LPAMRHSHHQSRRRISLAFVAGFVMTFWIATVGIGGATVNQHMYPFWWHSNPTAIVDSIMPVPFNTATARSEMAVGVQTWNISGAARHISVGPEQNIPAGVYVQDVPNGRIWLTNQVVTPPAFARNTVRFQGNMILASLMEFDVNNVTWHISSLTTQPVG